MNMSFDICIFIIYYWSFIFCTGIQRKTQKRPHGVSWQRWNKIIWYARMFWVCKPTMSINVVLYGVSTMLQIYHQLHTILNLQRKIIMCVDIIEIFYKLTLLKKMLMLEKSLKIPKEWSEDVNRRRTDNTMTKRKRTKGQTMV